MVAVFIGLILIGCIVVMHELGHLIMAKLLGVKVEVFSIGFGPTIFSRSKNETEYQLALIPIGGYVKMSEDVLDNDSFGNQNIFKKSLIILAGPVFNILFAIFLFFLVGIGFHLRMAPVIFKVIPGSIAARVGFLPGDFVTSINNVSVKSCNQLFKVLLVKPGKIANFDIVRNGKLKKVSINCKDSAQVCTSKLSPKVFTRLGVEFGNSKLNVIMYTSFSEAFISAIHTTRLVIRSIIISVVNTINLSVSQIKIKIAGPIVIISESHHALLSGYSQYLQLMAFMSINVGLFNLLPLPILDGGRLLFYIFESLTGRSINKIFDTFSISISTILLFILGIFALFSDFQRFL